MVVPANAEDITNDFCSRCQNRSHSNPLFPICNLIRQTDRNSKHLRIKIADIARIVHVSVPLCRFSAPVWTLLCCSGLVVIMRRWLPFVIPLFMLFSGRYITIMVSLISWAKPLHNRQKEKKMLIPTQASNSCSLPPRTASYLCPCAAVYRSFQGKEL